MARSGPDDEGATTTQTASGRGPVARVLLVFSGDQPQAITLPDVETLTIGRGADAGLRIEDPGLSRMHARLRFDLHVTLEDLDSSNGTFIGGVRLTPGKPVVIAPGATIQLGTLAAILHFGADAAPTLVGTSDGSEAGARALETVVLRIAQTELSVVLIGESGAGKKTLARRLHDASRRSAGPFAVLGASAVGRAVQDGTLARVAGGTLVIDEPADLDRSAARLLLEAASTLMDAPRLVATSTRDLQDEVDAGRMLPELYHRLAGVSILVPPLRERVHEIARLTQTIAAESAHAAGRATPVFSPDALVLLERHTWPGNLRELVSCVGRAVALSGSRVLTATHFEDLRASEGGSGGRVEAGRGSLREARQRSEYQQIIEALRATRGNQTRAAEALGISRSTLLARLEKYGVPRPRKV